MATYDSIINVEEWVSDHFLTTDEAKGESYGKRVAQRVKEWKDDEAQSGHLSPWSRFTSYRQELQQALATLSSDSAQEATTLIRRALGYGDLGRVSATRARATTEFSAWAGAAGSALLLAAEPIETLEDFLTTPVAGDVQIDAKPASPAAAALVGDLFLSDAPPEFIVVVAGAWVILAERDSWPLGRYLAVDLALVVERNDTKAKGEMQRVAVALARENVERAADGVTWWAETIEQSREHAVKVSGELRGAVRESIELIGNDVLNRHREQGLGIEEIDGNELAKQSLRYLYRILFLLFAEASPELEILPTGTPEYDEGYGLSRLRELILTPPVTQNARSGTHLYHSLQVLFELVDQGNDPRDEDNPDFDADATAEGLEFRNLSADLFQPQATGIINRVKLSNEALNIVLENLLLSKEQSGRERGFISYATLGVTELGQVYEGLMSYTGFIAEEDLFEVAPHGDPKDGSWVLPVKRADTVPQDSFVMQEVEANGGGVERRRRRHPRGSFVFRQASRDRERSASFYTPQVLTEFTVGQAIEVLQETGRIETADEVLKLSICEPAMGSGAFAVEAVRQLSELYVTLRQEELGEQISAEDRAKELQKIKAHIALHQVYGVDLNATAVELAEISLWLDTMTPELKAPWFGLHLRRGNSLIGANRATYAPHQLKKKAWLTAVPERRPLTDIAEAVDSGTNTPVIADGIHHFLLPSNGWGATVDAKDVKDITGEEQKELKGWRRSITVTPTKKQTEQLKNLSRRVEKLWRFALIRMRIAGVQARREIDLWGQKSEGRSAKNVSRAQIEADLFDNLNGSYNRLRMVMDAWTALWFWPLDQVRTEGHPDRPELPDFDGWLAVLTDVLGTDARIKAKDVEQYVLGWDADWEDLNSAETADWQFAGALDVEKTREKYPWLAVAQEVAKQQGFFHWDLDFAAVFAQGGFDLQVGNPPWVQPDINFNSTYAEFDPWWALEERATLEATNQRMSQNLTSAKNRRVAVEVFGETASTSEFLGSEVQYPFSKLRTNLYKSFLERTWSNGSMQGAVSLIHPETHFVEKATSPLRRESYLRLRRHWQFSNHKSLFEIDKKTIFGVHVYGQRYSSPDFVSANFLLRPDTVTNSFLHDGKGTPPGISDENDILETRPHADRLIHVDMSVLEAWASLLEEPGTSGLDTVSLYVPNSNVSNVLQKLSKSPRASNYRPQISSGWNTTTGRRAGFFDYGWHHSDQWSDVFVEGRHLGIATSLQKIPMQEADESISWIEVDLEALREDYAPPTTFMRKRSSAEFSRAFGKFETSPSEVLQVNTFRLAWREFSKIGNFRTLYSSIIPHGPTHTNSVRSCIGGTGTSDLLVLSVMMSSFLIDCLVRAIGSDHISQQTVLRLPISLLPELTPRATTLYLRLTCLTSAFGPLWEDATGEEWNTGVPLRNPKERFHAQNEIDAIVALSLGVTVDELCMIYRTQFPVMRGYDQKNLFDSNGRKVEGSPFQLQKKLKGGEKLTEAQRTWVHPQSEVTYVFEYPFAPLDREADLRAAYAKYEKLVQEA